jgi:hypothetical protein
MRAECDEKLTSFDLNTRYSYLRQTGEVTFFTSDIEGDLRPLRLSYPWGFRLRRSINGWLAVSLGLTGLWGSRVSSYKNSVSVVEAIGRQYVYFVDITDFTLAAKGLAPLVGLHLGKNLSPGLRLEAHISGGPLFAECRYSMVYEEAPTSDLGEYYEMPYNGLLEEKGKGLGLALSAGVSLNVSLGMGISMFLEAGHVWQTVHHVSGPGSRLQYGTREYWEDVWYMKAISKNKDWGSLYLVYPSNHPPDKQDYSQVRPFKLDLSGAQVRIGFSYRL